MKVKTMDRRPEYDDLVDELNATAAKWSFGGVPARAQVEAVGSVLITLARSCKVAPGELGRMLDRGMELVSKEVEE